MLVFNILQDINLIILEHIFYSAFPLKINNCSDSLGKRGVL